MFVIQKPKTSKDHRILAGIPGLELAGGGALLVLPQGLLYQGLFVPIQPRGRDLGLRFGRGF